MTSEFEQYKSGFDRDGFVVVPRFLINKDFDDLKGNLTRYIRDIVPTLPDSDAFYQDHGKPETLKQMQNMGGDAFFAAYRNHPRWVELAEVWVEFAEGVS